MGQKRKDKKMNTKSKPLASLGAVTLIALIAVGCASSGGKSSVRVMNEEKFIPLHHVADTSRDVNLRRGDTVAMACSKCKTVLVSTVGQARNHFYVPLEHQHYCPGCKSTITTTYTGLSSKQEIRHTCKECGDDSVFCCATQPGAGPTPGMEK